MCDCLQPNFPKLFLLGFIPEDAIERIARRRGDIILCRVLRVLFTLDRLGKNAIDAFNVERCKLVCKRDLVGLGKLRPKVQDLTLARFFVFFFEYCVLVEGGHGVVVKGRWVLCATRRENYKSAFTLPRTCSQGHNAVTCMQDISFSGSCSRLGKRVSLLDHSNRFQTHIQ